MPAEATPARRPLRRLTGQGAFDAVLRAGRRMHGHHLQIVVAPAPESGGRTGFIISRKASKRAVDRNRVRRKLRELLRTLPVAYDRFDLVLRVVHAKGRAQQDAATAEAAQLLARLDERSGLAAAVAPAVAAILPDSL